MLNKCQLLLLLVNTGTVIISNFLGFLEKVLFPHLLTSQNSFIWFDTAFKLGPVRKEKYYELCDMGFSIRLGPCTVVGGAGESEGPGEIWSIREDSPNPRS